MRAFKFNPTLLAFLIAFMKFNLQVIICLRSLGSGTKLAKKTCWVARVPTEICPGEETSSLAEAICIKTNVCERQFDVTVGLGSAVSFLKL